MTSSHFVVYYTGNTWQNPGDIVTLSGHHTGLAVKEVFLSRLDDESVIEAAPRFIDHARYDRSLTAGEQAYTVPGMFREEESENCKIIQRTEDSIKIRIPDSFTPGIYSVLLRTEDPDESRTLYLNIPKLNFLLGDEGTLATPGGTIRLIGSCLAAEGSSASPVLFLEGDKSFVRLTDVQIQNPYSVTFRVPETIPYGTYRLFYHSGFGGATAWSLPLSVTIGARPSDSWPKEVFDVTRYGAKGQGTRHNDMPGVILALRAAARNGGGIVYFPKGTYMLNYPVPIPENVTLQGEGITKSKIIYLPYLWDIGELPKGMLVLNGNVKIDGIDFSGTRMGPLFYSSGAGCKNIYITNCRIYLSQFAGSPTEGMHARGNGKQATDIYAEVHKELNSFRNINGSPVFKLIGVENLQIRNNYLDTEGGSYRLLLCKGVHVADNIWLSTGEASLGGVEAAVLERNTYNGPTNSISGDGIYYAYNKMMNRDINNREIMTSDGPGFYGSSNGRCYLKASGRDHMTYELDQAFAKDSLKGKQLILQEGTGEGQMRRIVSNEGSFITVDSPFTVMPEDQKTKVSIMSARSDTIIYHNYMFNGGDFQFYGTQLNTVMDGNTLEKVRGIVSRSGNIYNFLQPNWYLSFINNVFFDANYLHNVGYTEDWLKALSKFEIWGGSPVANNHLCITVRNNRFKDGYFLYLKGEGAFSTMTDLTIQNNEFLDSEYGIYHAASDLCDGILFIGNQFRDVRKPYSIRNYDGKCRQINPAGDSQILFLDQEAADCAPVE